MVVGELLTVSLSCNKLKEVEVSFTAFFPLLCVICYPDYYSAFLNCRIRYQSVLLIAASSIFHFIAFIFSKKNRFIAFSSFLSFFSIFVHSPSLKHLLPAVFAALAFYTTLAGCIQVLSVLSRKIPYISIFYYIWIQNRVTFEVRQRVGLWNEW